MTAVRRKYRPRAAGMRGRSATLGRAVAKKPRTPAPPRRPIQAPQRRDTRRRGAAGDRNRLWMIVGVLALVAVAAIAAALYFALRGSSSNSSSSKSSSGGFEMRVAPAKDRQYNRLPGVTKTKAPWPPEFAHLDGRLAPLGLQALSQEA